MLGLTALPEETSDGNGPERIEAVLDTGFTGHLLPPPSVVSELSLPRIGSSRPTLADGSIGLMSVHLAQVVWHGRERPVRVLASEGGSLIDMALLHGSRLEMDVVPGGEVVIE